MITTLPTLGLIVLNARLTILALGIGSLLSACATQTYEPKPIEPETIAASFVERSLDDAELQHYMVAQGYATDAFPLRQWGVHELTLAAFFHHPQLAVARAEWQAARAREVTAGQKPNPSISTEAEHHSRTEGGISPWTLTMMFEIPIETGDKRRIRVERATSLSQAARLDIGQQAWRIRSHLRGALLEYQSAQHLTELLKRELGLQDAIVQMLEKRFEAGMVSDIDLSNARLQRQKMQHTLDADLARLADLRIEIANAMGVPAAALDKVQLDMRMPQLPTPEALPPAALQRTALLNRLDIRAALARYEAAESQLRLEIAKQRPDIVLAPGYSFDQGDNRWSLGLSLLLALLNKNEGPIAEAEAQRELEARQFEALQIRVIGEQEQALARYKARLSELAKAKNMLATQERRLRSSERQFAAGYIDRLEWTTAQLESLTAEQASVAAAIRAQQALAALEDTLQRPLDGSAPLPLPEQPREESAP